MLIDDFRIKSTWSCECFKKEIQVEKESLIHWFVKTFHGIQQLKIEKENKNEKKRKNFFFESHREWSGFSKTFSTFSIAKITTKNGLTTHTQ